MSRRAAQRGALSAIIAGGARSHDQRPSGCDWVESIWR